MNFRETPKLSNPANRIAGKNRMPTGCEVVASPVATPANVANLQLRDSAHRHPRYRARVEKNTMKMSRNASRPKTRVRGEIVQSASAKTPVQYPATRRAKAKSTSPVRRVAVTAGIRTTPASEEPETTWVRPRMYLARKGCSWLGLKLPSRTYASPAF